MKDEDVQKLNSAIQTLYDYAKVATFGSSDPDEDELKIVSEEESAISKATKTIEEVLGVTIRK